MFRTMYDRKALKPVKANPGSGTKTEYQLRISKTNEEILEPIGKSSLYDYIQSHADSVDIHKILERCAMTDDYSYLNRMPAQYMDLTEMPKNLAEAHAMVMDAKEMFDRMPLDIKEKYDNNFISFISSIGSEKFNNVVGEFLKTVKEKENPAPGTIVKTEVNDNVEKS